MAKPALTTITSSKSWDGEVNDNFDVLGGSGDPVPVPRHAGDETDLQTTFPAASFAECQIWVAHSTLGLVLAYSDGTSWIFPRGAAKADISASGTTADAVAAELNDLLAKLRAAQIIET